MIDGGLRGTFREKLREGIHWQSIETGGTGKGIPDSNFCARWAGRGIEGWIEYKWTEAWAVGLEPEQVGWLKKRVMFGGRALVAVRRCHEGGPRKGAPQDELWLYSGLASGLLRREGLSPDHPGFLGWWEGGKSKWDWDQIRYLLLHAVL